MPQTIWAGTISIGLVAVPVRLYPATRRQDLRFHEMDRRSGQRIRHERVRAQDVPPEHAAAFAAGEPVEPVRIQEQLTESVRRASFPPSTAAPAPQPVAYRDVVKGVEVAPHQYVTVTRDELAAIAPERSRSIDIEQFVPGAAIDPIFFQASYYVVPDRDQVRSFALLLEAMRTTDQVAICWIVLRRKRHLAALRPLGDLMLLTTMFYADEILPRAGLERPAPQDLTRREREMAALLVTTLSGPFEPDHYRDAYRQRVSDLIAGKTPVAVAAVEAAPSPGPDLMAALRASVEQARQQRTRSARTATRPPARRRRKSA
ncbi:MAG TPA: Ku protein [Candidatus Limnocylindrales bacterium]|nr:Ku protein [Candidatus Limnocylindrales bacterium]